MGRKLSTVTDEARGLLYPLGEGDRGEALIYCSAADGALSPVELSSWLLAHLKAMAAAALGESIEGAVVCVPARFDARQRNATLEAAEMAGLSRVHLLQGELLCVCWFALCPRSIIWY